MKKKKKKNYDQRAKPKERKKESHKPWHV